MNYHKEFLTALNDFLESGEAMIHLQGFSVSGVNVPENYGVGTVKEISEMCGISAYNTTYHALSHGGLSEQAIGGLLADWQN